MSCFGIRNDGPSERVSRAIPQQGGLAQPQAVAADHRLEASRQHLQQPLSGQGAAPAAQQAEVAFAGGQPFQVSARGQGGVGDTALARQQTQAALQQVGQRLLVRRQAGRWGLLPGPLLPGQLPPLFDQLQQLIAALLDEPRLQTANLLQLPLVGGLAAGQIDHYLVLEDPALGAVGAHRLHLAPGHEGLKHRILPPFEVLPALHTLPGPRAGSVR